MAEENGKEKLPANVPAGYVKGSMLMSEALRRGNAVQSEPHRQNRRERESAELVASRALRLLLPEYLRALDDKAQGIYIEQARVDGSWIRVQSDEQDADLRAEGHTRRRIYRMPPDFKSLQYVTDRAIGRLTGGGDEDEGKRSPSQVIEIVDRRARSVEIDVVGSDD